MQRVPKVAKMLCHLLTQSGSVHRFENPIFFFQIDDITVFDSNFHQLEIETHQPERHPQTHRVGDDNFPGHNHHDNEHHHGEYPANQTCHGRLRHLSAGFELWTLQRLIIVYRISFTLSNPGWNLPEGNNLILHLRSFYIIHY